MATSLRSRSASIAANRPGRKSTVAEGDWKQYTRATAATAAMTARCALR